MLGLAVESALGAAHNESASIDLSTLADKARSAVMLMVVCDASGLEIAHGTGFLLSSNGRLITNRHVIRAGPIAFAKARNGKRCRVLGFLAEDPEHDLVLLQIEGEGFPSLPLGSSKIDEPGQPIAVVGNPLVWEGVFSPGNVVSVREFLGERGWIQIRADIAPGSSGSPVLNARGEVIGIVAAMLRSKPTLGLAIPVEVAKRLLGSVQASSAPKPLASMESRKENDVFMDNDFQAAQSASFASNYDEAQKRVDSVVKRFPRSAVAHLLHAQIAEQRSAHDEAVAACRTAIQLNPKYAMAWGQLGEIYGHQKKYAEAYDALQQAVRLKPDYVEAWERLGEISIQQKQFGRAADAYRQASQLRPDDEKLWYNLGHSYARQNKQDHAAWAYKIAVGLKPDQPELWCELGTAYAKQGQFQMAADAFTRAAKLKPQDSVTWYNLGLAWSELGQKEKAQEALQQLRKLDASKAEELEKHLQ